MAFKKAQNFKEETSHGRHVEEHKQVSIDHARPTITGAGISSPSSMPSSRISARVRVGRVTGGRVCVNLQPPRRGPAEWANLRRMHWRLAGTKMKICAPPKAYSISLSCTDTAPAARRQRAGSAWNRSKAVKPYLIGLSVSHQRHTHVLSSRVCTL